MFRFSFLTYFQVVSRGYFSIQMTLFLSNQIVNIIEE